MAHRLLFASLLLLAPFTFARDGGEACSFDTSSTTVWIDRAQVVPFRVPSFADEDRSFEAVSSTDALEIVGQAEVLAGETLGFVRVRGMREGDASIELGGATLEVDVRELAVEAECLQPRARITNPVHGANVDGAFSVGVEVELGAARLAEGEPFSLELLSIADGGSAQSILLTPAAIAPAKLGPTRRLRFEVDASALPPGPLELRARVELEDTTLVGDPTLVAITDSDRRVEIECESTLFADRPEGFGRENPAAGASPSASGEGYAILRNQDPVWITHLAVRESGNFQAFVRGRGTFGAGAYPSVGVCVDDANSFVTAGRLLDSDWHRVAVGTPIALEEGEHTLALRFINESQTTQRRRLHLDSFELVRVEAPAYGGSMMSMGMAEASMTGSAMAMDANTMWANARPSRASRDLRSAPYVGSDVYIALRQPFDGLPVNGRAVITGQCRWNDGADAPVVELWINDRVVARQQAARPTFALDRSHFELGTSRVQLVATMPDGRTAETPTQTVFVSERASEEPTRSLHRFEVLDRRWDETTRALLDGENEIPGHRMARAVDAAVLRLQLPHDMAGEFDVLSECRGPEWPHMRVVRYGIERPDENGTTTVEDFHTGEHHGWWNPDDVGTVTLEEGPKTLVVDVAEKRADDERDLYLRSILFRERRARPDRTPPRARIVYPKDGQTVAGVDVVILEAWDEDDRLGAVDVVLDGEALGYRGHLRDGFGYAVLPLILRDVEPGVHRLTAGAADLAGNVGEADEIEIVVSDAERIADGPYARAVRLLDRFAFGPDPQELAAILTTGERAWLERRLSDAGAGDLAARERGSLSITDGGPWHHQIAPLMHALRTTNPVWARFSFWIDDHFSTWIGKTQGPSEWKEYLRFAELGPAPFAELLATSTHSTAMLYYLDQATSYAARLNENYAREIMELHSLGVDGGYTQKDVTALASLLAGLTLSDEALATGGGQYLQRVQRYDPALGDSSERRIAGMRFAASKPEERHERVEQAFALLAGHPSTARHVCRKLAEHYVSSPAPDELVDDLARVFTENGGELRAVLLAIAEHPAFWDAPARVTTPFDYGTRLLRTVAGVEIEWALHEFLQASGMGVFDRQSPDGYPDEDEAWVDSNCMLQRWNLSRRIPWYVRGLVPDGMRNTPIGDSAKWSQQIVDAAAVRLTGWTLGEESNNAAIAYLEESEGQIWSRIDETAVLVSRLPEAGMK